MALIQQVRFNIFSKKERQELQNEVIGLEELAERKNAAVQKINKSKLAKRGGIFAPNELDATLPSAITKKEGAALSSRLADSKNANATKNKDTSSKNALLDTLPEFKTAQNDIEILKVDRDRIQSSLDFVIDFQGTGYSKFLGAANKLVPIGFALAIAATVFGLIQSQFGKGGIWDRRKLELNAVKSLYGLERETDIVGGDTLFLGNPTLVQGIPKNTTSNTVNLRDGQRRFVLRSNGF